MGASINYVSRRGGRVGILNAYVTTLAYVVNLLTDGEEGGSKIGKILLTWFMDAP